MKCVVRVPTFGHMVLDILKNPARFVDFVMFRRFYAIGPHPHASDW